IFKWFLSRDALPSLYNNGTEMFSLAHQALPFFEISHRYAVLSSPLGVPLSHVGGFVASVILDSRLNITQRYRQPKQAIKNKAEWIKPMEVDTNSGVDRFLDP
ncbi:hypothetical protein ACJX0J_009191, partial [Zea mays]